MRFKLFFVLALTTFSVIAQAQIAKDFMIGAHLDLAKTDNNIFLGKAQIGTEVNYFITRNFTGTSGFEFWTDEGVSFVVGGRWYPNEDLFVRVRGLVGENDLSIGGGWSKPMNNNIRFEAIGDFYFSIDFSIRVGFIYIIRRK